MTVLLLPLSLLIYYLKQNGADSQVILVSTSQQLIDEVENEIEIQLDALPRNLAVKAIANSKLIFVENDTML
jgi:histidinol dehydrogenase